MPSVLTLTAFFVEGGRGRGCGLLERRGLLKNSTSRRGGLLERGGLIRERGGGLIRERGGLLELLR